MRVGLAPPNYAAWFDADALTAVARHAETLGYHSLWFGDHLALPRDQAAVFGNAYADALAVISFAAAVTDEIRLGTNVLVVPYRHPIVTAKLVATADQLSKGRVDLGVGIGHVAGEFAALGLPFADRGRMFDEYVHAMKALWNNDCASFSGNWINFEEICPLTRPVQQPLPLLVGGDGPRSMHRAIELDAGWAPGQSTMSELERKVRRLRQLASERERPCPRIVVRWLIHPVRPGSARPAIAHRGELRRPRLDPSQAREQLAFIEALGVDELIADIPAHRAGYLDTMELIADTALRR